ncbi:MAG: isoprenyl transferase [Flavobacteriaceae bacterium]|nr:isoprenyl transferase [Flavobacteriaceae bacterium]
MNLKKDIIIDSIPNHIAIIMDGNGRWAKQKNKSRDYGHKEGEKSVKKIVKACAELGVKNLTLFAFSTENWNRPKLEINFLMKLLLTSLNQELKTLTKNNVRFKTIGNLEKLPKKLASYLINVTKKTQNNNRMTLTLALSYGAREEIVYAMQAIGDKVKNNLISLKNIDESVINQHLYTHYLPDVDLLIRTSGEKRISNFLLWQIAYAELYFTEKLWPDFSKEDLYEAIVNYQRRERRFGKTSKQIN